jgi:uncharacterized DUF497 family protein
MPPKFQRFWYDFKKQDFYWDAKKSSLNLEDRGFDFGVACGIFSESILRRQDTRRKGEAVFQALGETRGIVLFVVYTIRNQRCRIISARQATIEEIALYHAR